MHDVGRESVNRNDASAVALRSWVNAVRQHVDLPLTPKASAVHSTYFLPGFSSHDPRGVGPLNYTRAREVGGREGVVAELHRGHRVAITSSGIEAERDTVERLMNRWREARSASEDAFEVAQMELEAAGVGSLVWVVTHDSSSDEIRHALRSRLRFGGLSEAEIDAKIEALLPTLMELAAARASERAAKAAVRPYTAGGRVAAYAAERDRRLILEDARFARALDAHMDYLDRVADELVGDLQIAFGP